MYRSYLKAQTGKTANAQMESSAVEEEEKANTCKDAFDQSVQDEVKRVWQEIEKQCADVSHSTAEDESSTSETVFGSNVVRVFVSSTFTDFFNEREALVKKAFPEVREWCQNRGLKLVECDLRWGIPKDTSTGDTILVCLDEIERCRETSPGEPFFISLLGERYGWVPTIDEVPDEAKEKYGWVSGSSITFMEILEGAFRKKNQNAAFFLRHKSVLDDVPDEFVKRFKDTEPLARHHLEVMKRKIRAKFPDQIVPYECKFKEISNRTGREQVEFTDLEDFVDKVVNFLKVSIENMYLNPRGEESVSDIEQHEQELQKLFAVDKAKDLIGRQTELSVLKEFLEQGSSSHLEEMEGSDSTIRKVDDWDLCESDTKICVVEGSSGMGKTALMCKLISNTAQSETNLFYHIVGSTQSSHQVDKLLRGLVQALVKEPTEEEIKTLEGGTIAQLQALLRTALSNYRKNASPKMIIILDGLNELEDSETIHHLSWLPPAFPSNIQCIVSTNPHRPTLARIYEHPSVKMSLGPLTSDELAEVAVRYLEKFNKKLEPNQMKNLMETTGADNPMWMMLMAEELRIFGDFRLLDAKIADFPKSMEGLLAQIIDRLIQEDDEKAVVQKAPCIIACSRHGIPSDKVLQILGNPQTKEELVPFYWARARRSLKPFLRIAQGVQETIAFSHEAVLKAVCRHLLATDQDIVQWNTVLADYYQYWCSDARSKIYHLPHHLERARLKKRMVEFLVKDRDSYFYMAAWQRSQLIMNVRCRGLADALIPNTAPRMLCHMCAMKTSVYNPACTWQNKNCCILCGTLCSGHGHVDARGCMRHAQIRGRDVVKCVLCNFTVNIKTQTGPTAPTQALLCRFCGFGNGSKTCATFDV